LSYASLFEVSQTCDKQSTGRGDCARDCTREPPRVQSASSRQIASGRAGSPLHQRLALSPSVSARMDQPSVKLPVFKIASGALLGTR